MAQALKPDRNDNKAADSGPHRHRVKNPRQSLRMPNPDPELCPRNLRIRKASQSQHLGVEPTMRPPPPEKFKIPNEEVERGEDR